MPANGRVDDSGKHTVIPWMKRQLELAHLSHPRPHVLRGRIDGDGVSGREDSVGTMPSTASRRLLSSRVARRVATGTTPETEHLPYPNRR